MEKSNFSDDDVKWIGSLVDVSVVTLQKKSIRVRTETEDAIKEIIDSINKKYCNSSKPKLSPLF
jgi:trehalose-6-phosphate synthase